MSLIEQIRRCTYIECFECTSVHEMNYVDGFYICEECYRELNVKNIINPLINWKQFINLVKKSNTPKKIMKILLNKIYQIEYTEEEIDNYYNDLMEMGQLERFNWLFNCLIRTN